MFKKLINGELGFAKTFWIYGFLFILMLTIIAKISTNMLYDNVGSIDLLGYYIKSFNLAKINSKILALVLFNISSIIVLVVYSFCMFIAIWKSSNKYDKSTWLVYISRFSMLLMIFICLSITL